MALRILTKQHIKAAKAMPRKKHPLISVANSKEGKSYARRNKKDRKSIADYYRFVKKDPAHGPKMARLAHRHQVVMSGNEARTRLKNMTA